MRELRAALFDLLAKASPKKLVLNLAQVPYMDSSAVAVLVELLQKLRKTGGTVCLTSLQPRVQGLLEIARLNKIFLIAKDDAEAVKMLIKSWHGRPARAALTHGQVAHATANASLL